MKFLSHKVLLSMWIILCSELCFGFLFNWSHCLWLSSHNWSLLFQSPAIKAKGPVCWFGNAVNCMKTSFSSKLISSLPFNQLWEWSFTLSTIHQRWWLRVSVFMIEFQKIECHLFRETVIHVWWAISNNTSERWHSREVMKLANWGSIVFILAACSNSGNLIGLVKCMHACMLFTLLPSQLGESPFSF